VQVAVRIVVTLRRTAPGGIDLRRIDIRVLQVVQVLHHPARQAGERDDEEDGTNALHANEQVHLTRREHAPGNPSNQPPTFF
jgi:hypothetical protein